MNEIIPAIKLQLREHRLSPKGRPVHSLNVNGELINDILNSSDEKTDLRTDWSSLTPESFGGVKLSSHDRRKLQNLSLLLCNRRIVCGYELLDNALREKLSPGNRGATPPTWLTVGKWTARAIGDLLDDKISLTRRERQFRMAVRYLLASLFRARVMPMGRILVTGNRVIFAQVGGLIAELLSIDFQQNYHRCYPQFLLEYEDRLRRAVQATAGPVIRNPLSDSMLRAAYAYYRAMDAADDPGTWILAANLHLAAYEQHIAELFVHKSMSFRPTSAVKALFQNPRSDLRLHLVDEDSLPMDMGLEGLTIARIFNVLAATFATRFILSFPVGISGSTPLRKDGKVLAPAYPFHKAGFSAAVEKYVYKLARSGSPAAENLKEVWSALDYAYGAAHRTRVRDWRNYPYRVSYIANLFVICQSEGYREVFQRPVLDQVDMEEFLSGNLPSGLGVKLNRKQERQWSQAHKHDLRTERNRLADCHDEREPDDWPVRYLRALADFAKMATAIAVLGGFLLVSLAKTGMNWFYARFDVTPDEVGLSQTSILFQTAATAIVVLTGSALAGLGISAVATRVARRGNRVPAGPPSLRSLIREPGVAKWAALVALVILFGYFVWGVASAEQSIARIQSGNSTSSQIFAHGEIVAWCVDIWWDNPRLNKLFGGPPARRLMFLGQTSGIAVFYDAKTRHTIRVPVSDIVTRSC